MDSFVTKAQVEEDTYLAYLEDDDEARFEVEEYYDDLSYDIPLEYSYD